MEETKNIGNPRYTDREKDLIKNTFAENEDIIKALQKSFLQLPLNAIELSTLTMNIKGEMLNILRKTFLPELTDDVPPFNVYDMWQTLDIKGKMWEDVVLGIKSSKIMMDYLDQQLKAIEKGEFNKKQKIDFKELTNIKDGLDQNIYLDVMARNSIIVIVQGSLARLYAEAGKNETASEKEERLEQDSTK